MHFLWVFLIFVLLFTLAQSQALTSLTHYKEAKYTFNLVDKNHNNYMERSECIASFNSFKANPADSGITRQVFVAKMVGYGQTSSVGNVLFDRYDQDTNNVLNESDFNAMYTLYDLDEDGYVTSVEFIRYYNDLLDDAGSAVRSFPV